MTWWFKTSVGTAGPHWPHCRHNEMSAMRELMLPNMGDHGTSTSIFREPSEAGNVAKVVESTSIAQLVELPNARRKEEIRMALFFILRLGIEVSCKLRAESQIFRGWHSRAESPHIVGCHEDEYPACPMEALGIQ